jgi:hypothetical protein
MSMGSRRLLTVTMLAPLAANTVLWRRGVSGAPLRWPLQVVMEEAPNSTLSNGEEEDRS